MLPHLSFWGLRIPTHEFFMLAGFLVAGAVLYVTTRRAGRWDEGFTTLIAGALLGAALFAKAGASWRYVIDAEHPTFLGVWVYGGKSLLGGLAGAYVGVLVAKRIIGYRRSTGDLFVPAVALGLAVGRIGCFLTEQVGTPTSLPWGITLSPDVAAGVPNCPQCLTGVPMHPSFIYEITFLILLFAVLQFAVPRFGQEGDRFKLFLIVYGVFRFLIEFTRGNPTLWWGLSGSQAFLLFMSPLSVWAVVRMFLSRRRIPIAAEPMVPA